MQGKVYDILKFIAQIVLPALGALYGTLAGIWGLPYGEAIVATISAIDVFLGAILMIDSSNFFKTKIIVDIPEEVKEFDNGKHDC